MGSFERKDDFFLDVLDIVDGYLFERKLTGRWEVRICVVNSIQPASSTSNMHEYTNFYKVIIPEDNLDTSFYTLEYEVRYDRSMISKHIWIKDTVFEINKGDVLLCFYDEKGRVRVCFALREGNDYQTTIRDIFEDVNKLES